MKYAKYAVLGLLWMAGAAVAQPSTLSLDSVVLPASAVKAQALAPLPLDVPVQTHFVQLPELALEKALTSDESAGPAQKIGLSRAVAATRTVAQTQSALQWTDLPTGGQAAAINIQSPGAYGLRAGVLVESLPDGAQLRIYSQERPDAIVERSGAEINALLAQNESAGEIAAAARTWWTPDVGAGDATLEVVLPAGTAVDALRISIPMVSHIYQNLSLPTDKELAEAFRAEATMADDPASCITDASCTDHYRSTRDAVARMMYTRSNGESYLCTGTLVNNTKDAFTPYFLTAHHCLFLQSAASTLQTTWFYRSSRCDSNIPGANTAIRSAGATLLYADKTTDTSLLKLNEMPPAGVTFAGWDASTPGQTADAVYGLHHPAGSLLKLSTGEVSGYGSCYSDGGVIVECGEGDSEGDFYSVRWSQGITMAGSGGSALFRNHRLIGTLWGGASTCEAPVFTQYYGRFDKVFNASLWHWLANND
ncbi:trypsin-like peptidase domain-containing protein [Comamonas piscis]|uniref:Trypsin-like peptidase domain-containing protein n=1 Tax=Comamonas piscis TaxID=1562974 RepID=A0A7G5EE13_9BURK|nr:trypsin-like peptidase domain-containing protein [Comamonas piscis]QMV72238.1 trypsin-like peptidase domain-containing protein [Comamonas piscis]WSO34999.1 trypsin-like peptidase domain-containing protein [Comamonas piscis]